MAENQNIEYKESWRDEYLKWVCGFANAQGGRIYIGMKDNGDVCGVDDAKRLLEDIPNKIRDTMGIIADVNLQEKDGVEYIERTRRTLLRNTAGRLLPGIWNTAENHGAMPSLLTMKCG